MLEFMEEENPNEKLNLTDKQVQKLNAYFLTLSKREIEIIAMRFGLEDEKLPYSKETLEAIITSHMKTSKLKRRPRTAGPKDYI